MSTDLKKPNIFKRRKSMSERTKGKDEEIVISGPTKMSHGLHVDADLNWSGPEAASQFVFTDTLGEGSFGRVYRATHRTSSFVIAVKCIPVTATDDISDVQHEIDILRRCSSTNIVSYFGSFKNGDDFWILMDYCAYGSLRGLFCFFFEMALRPPFLGDSTLRTIV